MSLLNFTPWQKIAARVFFTPRFALLLYIACISTNANAQLEYLPPVFQNHVVSMEIVSSHMFSTADANVGGDNFFVGKKRGLYVNQEFLLMSTKQANWFKIRHQKTLKFVTAPNASPGAFLTMQEEISGALAATQEFEFIEQSNSGRFKIHSRFKLPLSGLDLVLEIAPGVAGITAIRLGSNIPTAADDHQKFDLALMFPTADPSSALPSLADKFRVATVGFEMRHSGRQLDVLNGTTLSQPLPYAGFNQRFAIEQTNEEGWFKIRHKISGKYVSVVKAVAWEKVALRTDAELGDDYQKFKFIKQNNNETYKIHTKFSYGIDVNKVGLVLEGDGSDGDIQCAPNNTTTTDADFNQHFLLSKFLPQAAGFERGAAVAGSGKILGKAYNISSKESLAMMEAYVSGADTLVRYQLAPVYGDQAEWIFDYGETKSGITYVRIRYGKTGQYLFMPVGSDASEPTLGMQLRLSSDNANAVDKRYVFQLTGDGSAEHAFRLQSSVGTTSTKNRFIGLNENGFLCTRGSGAIAETSYLEDQKFYINLSVPTDRSKAYYIISREQGLMLSDSSNRGTDIPLVGARSANYSCLWEFIPAGDVNVYFIRNRLSGQYLQDRNTYRSTAKRRVLTTPLRDIFTTKWRLVRDGNYLKIQSTSTDLGNNNGIMYIPKLAKPGSPVSFGSNLYPTSVADFMLSRADYAYLDDPIPPPMPGEKLLALYSPPVLNSLNDATARNKMMKNLGLPFEPKDLATLETSASAAAMLAEEGLGAGTSFIPVLKSALQYSLQYSSKQADSALQNYKLDNRGHRTDLVYALKKYTLERLAKSLRSSWSSNERQYAEWLERRIKKLKQAYSKKLQTAWNEFQRLANLGNGDLTFSALLDGPSTDFEGFQEPQYVELTPAQSESLMEYACVSSAKKYQSPGDLAALTVPMVASGGIAALSGVIQYMRAFAAQKYYLSFSNAVEDAVNAGAKGGRQVVAKVLKVRWIMKNGLSSGLFVAQVVEMAVELIVMEAIDLDRFIDFDTELKEKISLLKNGKIDITAVINGNSLLEKYHLSSDLDYILGTGQRFDGLGGLNVYEFTGNGNWSNPVNWKGRQVPSGLLPGDVYILINPVEGGECVLDIPVEISTGDGKIVVAPAKKFRIKSTLTIPNTKIEKQ